MPQGPLGFPRLTGVGPFVKGQSATELEDHITVDAEVQDDGAIDIEVKLFGPAEEQFNDLRERFGLSKEEMIDQAIELARESDSFRGDDIDTMVRNAIADYLAES